MIQALRKIMSGNRRQYPRVSTELEVMLHLQGHDSPLQVKTRNLSASGMEVVLFEPVHILEKTDVELRIPDEGEPLHVKGQFVRAFPSRTLWDRLCKRGNRYSVGISFLELEDALRARLIRYLQNPDQKYLKSL